MKRILYFFPYFLTNVGAIMFFMTGCFLIRDTYFNPVLIPTLYLFLKLFLALLLFSAPRYLLKKTVPESFKKPRERFLDGPFLCHPSAVLGGVFDRQQVHAVVRFFRPLVHLFLQEIFR